MRQNEEDPARHSRSGALIMVLLVLAALVLSFTANSWKRNLSVTEVRAYGSKVTRDKDIVALAAVDKAQKLYAVDLNAIRRRVEGNPYVRTASVTRDIPGRVTITVQERTPIAALLADRQLYIDEEAFVLPVIKSDQVLDLPFLTGALPASDCSPGRTVRSTPVREALGLLAGARLIGEDLYHGISEVHIMADGGLLCYMTESGVPVLFGQGNLPEKLVKFDSFWKEYVARQGVQGLQYVDLRFEDQVVARWNDRQELALHERITP